jgi:glycosyltransferase involved in cell wall biosynthesis
MSGPLASVLIPAYNERHFAAAFASARAQTYENLEIVVCDDSPEAAIAAVVEGANDSRVRYVRNRERLGFGGNFTRCLELARGEYVKFLNDDDLLLPPCVATFVAALERHPEVTLATSRRTIVDDAGARRPDVPPTLPLSYVSGVMPGIELGDFVLAHSMNFIGEPTTVMFRRGALALEEGALFRWHGRDYHCLADLAVWLRLLAKGAGYYHADALSQFRVHAGQEQRKADVNLLCLLERLWILEPARAAGFLAGRGAWGAALARVHALAGPAVNAGQVPRDWIERLEREMARAAI